jgi:hypothetical protein
MDHDVALDDLPSREAARLREDPRWQLALRIAESPTFASAPLLAGFLLFVCERTIVNRTEDLSERNIGVVVFHRRPDFKTSEDNIVRTYARQLRQRLDRYFEEHELDEPLRITVPRGASCAVFEERLIVSPVVVEGPAGQSQPVRSELPASGNAPSRPLSYWLLLALLPPLLIAAATSVRWYLGHRTTSISMGHALWAELFAPSMTTTIVSADSGLVVMEELTGRMATLEQYGDGGYFAQFDQASTDEERKLQRLSRERYTGIPDIDAAVALTSLPEAHDAHIALRNARALHVEDLKGGNMILLGSSYSTPWVALYEPQMNFRFRFDQSVYSSSFLNMHPVQGEKAAYSNSSTALPFETYAVIAYLPNLDGAGKVLLIEGLTTAGTEAAAELLLHGDIDSFLKTVPRDSRGLRPFELLVKTTSISSNASTITIVSKRIY